MPNLVPKARALRKRMTPEEVKLWVRLRLLRAEGFHFRRQSPIGPYIPDFVCRRHKVVIEVDGIQHGNARMQWLDNKRDQYLVALGYRVIRVWNGEVNRDPDSIIDHVIYVLKS
jgi:very-short-patch-repair endonuclease